MESLFKSVAPPTPCGYLHFLLEQAASRGVPYLHLG